MLKRVTTCQAPESRFASHVRLRATVAGVWYRHVLQECLPAGGLRLESWLESNLDRLLTLIVAACCDSSKCADGSCACAGLAADGHSKGHMEAPEGTCSESDIERRVCQFVMYVLALYTHAEHGRTDRYAMFVCLPARLLSILWYLSDCRPFRPYSCTYRCVHLFCMYLFIHM